MTAGHSIIVTKKLFSANIPNLVQLFLGVLSGLVKPKPTGVQYQFTFQYMKAKHVSVIM